MRLKKAFPFFWKSLPQHRGDFSPENVPPPRDRFLEKVPVGMEGQELNAALRRAGGGGGGLTTDRERSLAGDVCRAGKAPKYLLSGAPPPPKIISPLSRKSLAPSKVSLNLPRIEKLPQSLFVILGEGVFRTFSFTVLRQLYNAFGIMYGIILAPCIVI